MENSPLLWALVILVFILVFLRIFGRKLTDKMSFKEISRKWKYAGVGILVIVLMALIGSSLLLLDDEGFRYQEPKIPNIDALHDGLNQIGNSNSGEIRSIKQTICKAKDSVGEILCVKPIKQIDYYITEFINFDKRGNIIEREWMAVDSSDFSIRVTFIYNEKREISEQTTLSTIGKDSTIVYVQVLYEYRPGLRTETLIIDGSISSTTKCKYNSENLIADSSVYEKDGSLKTRTTFDYFDKNKKIEKQYDLGQLSLQKTLTFDKKGKCIQSIIERYIEGQKEEEKHIYEYDSQGRMVEKQDFSQNLLKARHTYSYESKRLIEIKDWFLQADSSATISKISIEFNKRKDIISETDSLFKNDEFDFSINREYDYKFDPKHEGFWVEMYHRIDGQIKYKIIREIELW